MNLVNRQRSNEGVTIRCPLGCNKQIFKDLKIMTYLDGLGKEFCLHCGLQRTAEGHDGCIGTLENVKNACCGHGETKMAYVQFDHSNYVNDPNKIWLGGQDALDYIKSNKREEIIFKD